MRYLGKSDRKKRGRVLS